MISADVNNKTVGIASIGLQIPSLAMDLSELARLRSVEPEKYSLGLGCQQMALCHSSDTIVDLATKAAERALSHWPKDKNQIGLIVTGTESGPDMSRPLSAWVADKLNIKGPVRSYEVKHACYGGTVALRQAVEWILSGAAKNKAALVIAADIALYEPRSPGEPTQGAGAVALIIDEPLIAAIDPISYAWSDPVFDFWHPLQDAYPSVDGKYSLECYQRAVIGCFKQLIGQQNPWEILNQYQSVCFHVPFPKMVKKAVDALAIEFQWNDYQIKEFFESKVLPTLHWNALIGNSYTASLWFAVSRAISLAPKNSKIAAFSYGSGCGAELNILTMTDKELRLKPWENDIKLDLERRRLINANEYLKLRNEIR